MFKNDVWLCFAAAINAASAKEPAYLAFGAAESLLFGPRQQLSDDV